MAEYVAVEGRQENLPNALSIYELITANSLDEIRSQLNPLTLRDRQSIVYQKVYKKTFLRHACERGFKRIVKYLLDECEADIAESDNPRPKLFNPRSKLLSPLRVSIKNVDLSMLILLLSRGVVAGDLPEAIKCSQYVLKNKYLTFFSILKKYMDEIALGSMEHSEDLVNLLDLMSDMDFNDARTFLNVVAAGNVDRIKTTLAKCMDPRATNDVEENALCVAILNEKSNAEHFLLNSRVFTHQDHVRALEMCGAKLIVFTPNFEKGLHYWRKSLRIRNERSLGVSDKFENQRYPELGIEFSIQEQIDRWEPAHADPYIQALLVFSRFLSPTSKVIQDAVTTISEKPAIDTDLWEAVQLLRVTY